MQWPLKLIFLMATWCRRNWILIEVCCGVNCGSEWRRSRTVASTPRLICKETDRSGHYSLASLSPGEMLCVLIITDSRRNKITSITICYFDTKLNVKRVLNRLLNATIYYRSVCTWVWKINWYTKAHKWLREERWSDLCFSCKCISLEKCWAYFDSIECDF